MEWRRLIWVVGNKELNFSYYIGKPCYLPLIPAMAMYFKFLKSSCGNFSKGGYPDTLPERGALRVPADSRVAISKTLSHIYIYVYLLIYVLIHFSMKLYIHSTMLHELLKR